MELMKKNKKIISFLIILIVTAIVLYFSLKDDYSTILKTIFSINKIWLFVAFLLLFGYYLLKSIVFYTFSKQFNKNYKYKDAVRLVLETNFFHAITPFSVGGQPYEVYSLTKHDIKITDATNISIECFIVYQIALVFLGLIAIVSNRIFSFLDGSLLKNLLSLGFIINFLVIVFLFLVTLSKKTNKVIVNFFITVLNKLKLVKNKEEIKEKFDNYLKEFNNGSKILFKDKTKFLCMIMLQFFSLLSLYLVPFALFAGSNISEVTSLSCIVTMAYVMLIGSFVPIPGGTGGLEYGFITLFANFVKTIRLNAIMLLWRFITYYFGMILGSVILNAKKEEK